MTDPRTRLTRALLLTAASLALVALVAVAAAGYRLSRPGSSHVSPDAVDTILTIVIALYVIGAIVVIVGMFWSGLGLRRQQRTQTRRERTIRSVVLLLSVGALITIAAERFHLRVHPRSAAANPTVAGNSSQGVNPNTARPSAARQARGESHSRRC